MALKVKTLPSTIELEKFLADTDYVHEDEGGHSATPIAKANIISIYFDATSAKHVVVYDDGV